VLLLMVAMLKELSLVGCLILLIQYNHSSDLVAVSCM
jgi:hypothetical protein